MREVEEQEALDLIKRLEDVEQHPLTEKEERELTEIESLDLSFTQISALPNSICKLVNLQTLNLMFTQIRELPNSISKLVNLQGLYLSGTQISVLPDSISKLVNLQMLNLSETQISALPDWIGELVNLQNLDLRGTQISVLPDSIGKLVNLKRLYLSGTQISALPDWIGKLVNLQELDLSGTQISTLPDSICKLVNLQWLDLSGTQISVLPDWIGELVNLQNLDLRGTQISVLPKELMTLSIPFVNEEIFGMYDEGVNLYHTAVTSPPVDLLLTNDREKIRAWYEADKDVRSLNEGKIIFLGDGNAGKTHSIRRIMQGGVDDNITTEVTHGINIEEWSPPHSDLTFHLWDFGGQHIMHSMHRCFLTRNCLYVVVLRVRSDSPSGGLTQQAKYWLDNIDSFAPKSSVLIAVNREFGDNGSGFSNGVNMEQLRADYADRLTLYDAVTYCAKGCAEDNFGGFMCRLLECAERLESTSRSIAVKWHNVRTHLDEINSHHNPDNPDSRPYLSETEYQLICDKFAVTDPTHQQLLLTLLNELGVCFSYHEQDNYGKQLEHYQVLNPNWLTTAIYAIITSGQASADASGEVSNPYHSKPRQNSPRPNFKASQRRKHSENEQGSHYLL